MAPGEGVGKFTLEMAEPFLERLRLLDPMFSNPHEMTENIGLGEVEASTEFCDTLEMIDSDKVREAGTAIARIVEGAREVSKRRESLMESAPCLSRTASLQPSVDSAAVALDAERCDGEGLRATMMNA